ncbi:MAG: hypothetical protein WAK15_15125, partial [Candidatus Cybelea sp.]
MPRRLLFALALPVLAAAAAAALTVPAMAQGSNVILTPEAHQLADQQVAINYARELIAAGQMDAAVKQLAAFVATHPDGTEAA